METVLNSFSPAQVILLVAMIAVIGACAGSVIYRCVGIMYATSTSSLSQKTAQCDFCKHNFTFFDSIPILSYIVFRGKCRYCKETISNAGIFVEIVLAFLFVLVFFSFDISVQVLTYTLLVCILIALSLVDVKTHTIPNFFIIAGIVLWMGSVLIAPASFVASEHESVVFISYWDAFFSAVFGGVTTAIIIAGCILVFAQVFEKLSGRHSLGGGDIKLYAMVGLYLGIAGSLVSLFLSCVIGLVFSRLWLYMSSSKVRTNEGKSEGGEMVNQVPVEKKSGNQKCERHSQSSFPFGPSIAIATILTLLIEPASLAQYFGFC